MITVYWPSGKKMRTLTDDDFKNLTAEELLSLHIEHEKSDGWYFSVYPDRLVISSIYWAGERMVRSYELTDATERENVWNDRKSWYIDYCSCNGYTVCFKYYTFTPEFDIIEHNFDNRVSFLHGRSNGIANSNRSVTRFITTEEWDCWP
jgi:hypothetical protein